MDLGSPFSGSAAVAAGLVTHRRLRGPDFRRVFHGVYAPTARPPTLALRSRAAYLLVAGRGALAGYSAAEVHGAGVAPREADAEVVVPGGDLREQPGLRVHRERLADDEVVARDDLLVTSPVRTAYDLARWCPLVEGVVAVDALARIGRFGVADLLALDRRRPGARWRQRVPRVVALADPLAQSPMETRARLVLVLRGLPSPVLQHQVVDEHGDHVASLDMAYPEARLGVEYEGAGHREDPTFGRDLSKHNRLQALQWVTLRITPPRWTTCCATGAGERTERRARGARERSSGVRADRTSSSGRSRAVIGRPGGQNVELGALRKRWCGTGVRNVEFGAAVYGRRGGATAAH